jgi:hypothetical protein
MVEWMFVRVTYPLLRETTGTLVLGVSEEFDDTLLVWGESVQVMLVMFRG